MDSLPHTVACPWLITLMQLGDKVDSFETKCLLFIISKKKTYDTQRLSHNLCEITFTAMFKQCNGDDVIDL